MDNVAKHDFKKRALFFSLAITFGATNANEQRQDTGHKDLSGKYRLYGGQLRDPVAASKQDTKIMFAILGDTARDMFEAMGPDVKDACTAQSGDRIRTKDKENLFCQKSIKGRYTCNFGFDLRTGKSLGGIVC